MIAPFYATFRVKSSAFLLPDIVLFLSCRSGILPKRFYCMELKLLIRQKIPVRFHAPGFLSGEILTECSDLYTEKISLQLRSGCLSFLPSLLPSSKCEAAGYRFQTSRKHPRVQRLRRHKMFWSSCLRNAPDECTCRSSYRFRLYQGL